MRTRDERARLARLIADEISPNDRAHHETARLAAESALQQAESVRLQTACMRFELRELLARHGVRMDAPRPGAPS